MRLSGLQWSIYGKQNVFFSPFFKNVKPLLFKPFFNSQLDRYKLTKFSNSPKTTDSLAS